MGLWFAFLRGINLGKRQVKMAELRTCLEAAGFTGIKTVVASGNVRLEAEGKAEAIRDKLEKAIEAQFGFKVGVVLRSEAEPIVELDDVLRDALSDLLQNEAQYGAVVDAHGRVAGVLSIEVIGHALKTDPGTVPSGADSLLVED